MTATYSGMFLDKYQPFEQNSCAAFFLTHYKMLQNSRNCCLVIILLTVSLELQISLQNI